MDFFRSVRDIILSFDWVKFIYSDQIIYWAYGLASFSAFISLIHIFRHLKNYTMPQIQTYVVRILFICPIFAISSAMALALVQNGEYVLIIRDVYEAVVVYSFLNLILEYCGGETDCVYQIENEPLLKMPPPLCCFKPKPRDAKLMRFCCRGVLQFVLVKPVVAAVDIVLLPLDLELEPIWQLLKLIIYNFSYGFALYCLLLFYLATKPIIKNFRPVYKFAAVKVVIFATYYQSLLVMYLTQRSGNSNNTSIDNNNNNNANAHDNKVSIEEAIRWNNVLLCAEMVFFSIGLIIAFPVSEFLGGIPDRRVMHNFKEVFTIKDVIENIRNNFMPRYRDYTLQRSQNETPVNTRVKTLFGANFKNSVAIEMTEVYRGKNRRSKFNSLLRGEQPITAKLRSSPCYYDSHSRTGSSSGVVVNSSSSHSYGMSMSRHSGKSGGVRTGRSGSVSSIQSEDNSYNTDDISSTYMLPLRTHSNASVESFNYYTNNNSSSGKSFHNNNSSSNTSNYNNNNSAHFNRNNSNNNNHTNNNHDDDDDDDDDDDVDYPEESKINHHHDTSASNTNTITRGSPVALQPPPPPAHHRPFSRNIINTHNNSNNADNDRSRSRSRSHSQAEQCIPETNDTNHNNDNDDDDDDDVVNPMLSMIMTASVLDANFSAHNKNSSSALAAAAAAAALNDNNHNTHSNNDTSTITNTTTTATNSIENDAMMMMMTTTNLQPTPTPLLSQQKIIVKLNHVVKKGKQPLTLPLLLPRTMVPSSSSSSCSRMDTATEISQEEKEKEVLDNSNTNTTNNDDDDDDDDETFSANNNNNHQNLNHDSINSSNTIGTSNEINEDDEAVDDGDKEGEEEDVEWEEFAFYRKSSIKQSKQQSQQQLSLQQQEQQSQQQLSLQQQEQKSQQEQEQQVSEH